MGDGAGSGMGYDIRSFDWRDILDGGTFLGDSPEDSIEGGPFLADRTATTVSMTGIIRSINFSGSQFSCQCEVSLS